MNDLMENDSIIKIAEIKEKIVDLYNQKKIIHVSVIKSRKKIKSAPANITGVYTNFFSIEAKVSFYNESFSINYVDIYTKSIVIYELNI